MKKIDTFLVGYGKVGESVLKLSRYYPDLEVKGIITRRPEEVKKQVRLPVYDLTKPETYLGWAPVAIMCGGSKNDLPVQTPFFARHFPVVVDSFDNHGEIGEHIDENGQLSLGHQEKINLICQASKHTAHISIGWHPGSFSLMEALFRSCLGDVRVYIFYGLTQKGGLSMGHTNALKRISGISDARQYTHAREEAIERVRKGETPSFLPGEKHWRECKVVLEENADPEQINKEIVNMSGYFAPYETIVKFISQEELDLERDDFNHDGIVLASGGAGYMEFKNVWNSNPEATAGFLLAYARATYRLCKEEKYGCFTVLDSPIRYLLPDYINPVNLI